jgi:hypothetical protein
MEVKYSLSASRGWSTCREMKQRVETDKAMRDSRLPREMEEEVCREIVTVQYGFTVTVTFIASCTLLEGERDGGKLTVS